MYKKGLLFSSLFLLTIMVSAQNQSSTSSNEIKTSDLRPTPVDYNNINYNNKGQFGKADVPPPAPSGNNALDKAVKNYEKVGSPKPILKDPFTGQKATGIKVEKKIGTVNQK